MAIDAKIEEYRFPEDSLHGSAEDVKNFFAAEKARKDSDYKAKMLSEKVDFGVDSAGKKEVDSKPEYKSYTIIPADTYALGVAALKDKGKVPFSFEQNIEARLQDYEAKGDKSELFGTWLDSITGIAYKKRSTKFKVKPVCDELKNIPAGFKKNFLPVDYKSFDGVELDSAEPGVKYNQDLTREEAKAHKGWLAAMNGNQALLNKYVDTWFDKTRRKQGMGFYVISDTGEGQLRSVVLSNDNYSSVVVSNRYLLDSARFVSEK